jgi:glycosyltransferase involved in cell wall biosynthesis
MIASPPAAEKKKDKILIVSYVFPPHPGIGGRRWTKFAKYFSKEGIDVHVICARNRRQEQSVWMDDVVKDGNIHVHEISTFFPKVFETPPDSFIKKILYRCWKLLMSIWFKGYIYDRALFSAKRFLRKAEEVVEDYDINKIIVTGAPFSLVHTIVCGRERWKNVHITADFRDPWTWEPSGAYQRIEQKRLLYEKKMEACVVDTVDLLCVPTVPMKQYLDSAYPHAASRICVVPHAWDEEEIEYAEKSFPYNKKLILFGTLYPGIEVQMHELARSLVKSKGLTLDIYSDSQAYMDIFRSEGAAHLVNYYKMLPSRQLYRQMHNYAAAVIINNESDKDHVSTKFIELAASGTPVIYMAAEGKASEFIENYNTGWHIKGKELPLLFEYILSREYQVPRPRINIMKLSFRNISRQFLNSAYHLNEVSLGELLGSPGG